ncbi:transposase family protein [Streptomyces sp. NPDC001795]|uniref:transposase family protein n=1 Tax=Streptomyces sp. NPDC001795 TaxID=3154525 RepID=UPI00331844AD
MPCPPCKRRPPRGLPTLADKGYICVGIHVPVRRPCGRSEQALHVDTRLRNVLIRHVRALGERTAAELKERWRVLKHVTLSPSRIGDIARTALVLNGQWK